MWSEIEPGLPSAIQLAHTQTLNFFLSLGWNLCIIQDNQTLALNDESISN